MPTDVQNVFACTQKADSYLFMCPYTALITTAEFRPVFAACGYECTDIPTALRVQILVTW